MTAVTEQTINTSVIAAVEMNFKKRTPFEQFWAFYMNKDHKEAFSCDIRTFVQACRVRAQYLGQGVR